MAAVEITGYTSKLHKVLFPFFLLIAEEEAVQKASLLYLVVQGLYGEQDIL